MQIGRKLALYIVLLAIILGCLLGITGQRIVGGAHVTGAPLAVTIDQLRAHPKEFAGKQVQIAGQLDECYGWECSLCPQSMPPEHSDRKQCLPLSFRPLIPETGFGSEEQEAVFRFADVVLTANFDPSCWQNPCLDRQTVLEAAQVTKVGKRRSGREGLWLGPHTALAELTGPVAAKVTAAAYASGYPTGAPMKVFEIAGTSRKFVVCWTSLDTALGSWPSSLEGSYAPGKSDFYRCNSVVNTRGGFVLQAMG
jgi:hypothetical protein